MAKNSDTTTANQPLVFKIEIPPIKNWNKDRGEYDPPTIYSTPSWVKYHEKMIVLDGQATTTDIAIALELVDMGATVTPDPRPLWQEQYAKQLETEVQTNPVRSWELSKYVNETNEWRAAHNLPPLSVKAPEVGRPMSALVMGVQSMG